MPMPTPLILGRVNKLTALAKPAARPLAGVKVVDISNFLAAPMCSMFLEDFGAKVIKVERPQSGDKVRYWDEAKNGVGLYCYIQITGYPDRPPLLSRPEPNYQDPQSTQRQEMQK